MIPRRDEFFHAIVDDLTCDSVGATVRGTARVKRSDLNPLTVTLSLIGDGRPPIGAGGGRALWQPEEKLYEKVNRLIAPREPRKIGARAAGRTVATTKHPLDGEAYRPRGTTRTRRGLRRGAGGQTARRIRGRNSLRFCVRRFARCTAYRRRPRPPCLRR